MKIYLILLLILSLLALATFSFIKAIKLIKLGKWYKNAIQVEQDKRQGVIIEIDGNEQAGARFDSIEAWEASLQTLWKHDGFPIQFLYSTEKNKPSLRRIILNRVSQDSRNRLYLHGFDKSKGEERSFSLQRINSRITMPGHQTMTACTFLETVCGINIVPVHNNRD
jgi:hypothetical protein